MSGPAKFLLDQMIDRVVKDTLLDHGYDVLAVSEIGMATADDAEIMQWAIDNMRTVITLDEHSGIGPSCRYLITMVSFVSRSTPQQRRIASNCCCPSSNAMPYPHFKTDL